tara:strand:- start:732 stop:914 length:183 start_codon:yes stop_codon:yes gene_type:complete
VKKVKLLKYFKKFTENPHHLAAISILQNELPDHLLSRDAEWIVCFEAEDECIPGFPKYNR